ncbi:hypothetical protein D3C80_1996930 [compost metagenome]
MEGHQRPLVLIEDVDQRGVACSRLPQQQPVASGFDQARGLLTQLFHGAERRIVFKLTVHIGGGKADVILQLRKN